MKVKHLFLVGCLIGTSIVDETLAAKETPLRFGVHSGDEKVCLKLSDSRAVNIEGNTFSFVNAIAAVNKVGLNYFKNGRCSLQTSVDILKSGANTIEHIVNKHITSEDKRDIVFTIRDDEGIKTGISIPPLFRGMANYGDSLSEKDSRDVNLKKKFVSSLVKLYEAEKKVRDELDSGYMIYDI